MITPDVFKDALLTQDYETMRFAIATGFDVNTVWQLGRPSFLQIAQTMNDMESLRILYEAGAVPDTPWLENLFKDFSRGVIRTHDGSAHNPCLQPGIRDLTENFTVLSLEYERGICHFSRGMHTIEITLKPFILDGECVQTSIQADRIALPPSLDDLLGQRFIFPRNPDAGYIDASLYLRQAHNPVYISSILFKNFVHDKRQIEVVMQMMFDFEEEMIGFANEALTLEIALFLEGWE
ncbi:MAG TPA: hypothetical protein DEF47_01710 [Herpetosiphon sp.]|uniref:Uncharacterized protein n=1 Tax=Herpetosiphon aurantiacus (strain ATCC 23779 / DSM 785 / 114-95) TaxID=316274 RepID=A9AVI9_HERA2|nr:hypothetical protein [Herpetosiphon sp.]ABX04680.1 hypothetical protein Haur_2037 [Herpetosiphon aurantiacus DSM 785]HBW48602.1 hypothetical protein [Herpetosiphon sp.]